MGSGEILEHVAAGGSDAGLIIHEGQLTFGDAGLHLVADLGEWWGRDRRAAPAARGQRHPPRPRPDLIARVSRLLRASTTWGLENRTEALAHAQRYGRGLDDAQTDEFVGMYVNARTLDYGDDGRRAVRLFLERGHEAGLIPHRVEVEFTE